MILLIKRAQKCALNPIDFWPLSDHKCCPSCPAAGNTLRSSMIDLPRLSTWHSALPWAYRGFSACDTTSRPERNVCCALCDSRVAIQTWELLPLSCFDKQYYRVSDPKSLLSLTHRSVPLFKHSTHFFQLPGKRNVFGGVNDFDNSSVVC